MKKKLFSLTIFVMLFISITNVYADTTCTYTIKSESGSSHAFKINFNSNGSSSKVSYIGPGVKIGDVVLHPNGERDATSLINVQVQLPSSGNCPSSIKMTKDYKRIMSATQPGDYFILNLSNSATPTPTTTPDSSNPSSGASGSGTPGWLNTEKVSCGNIGQIPAKAPELVHMFILIAQIAVPIILVILGMIDFAKGIMSQKEDEIKKGQKTFISRLIMGAVIFFVVALVKLLVGIVVDNSGNRQNIIACIDCFVNNDCG